MRPIDADKLTEKMLKTSRYFNIKFDIEESPTISEEELKNYLNIKDDLKYTIDDVAELLDKVFNDFPCCINDFDEFTFTDEWCEKKCGKVTNADCWKHFLINKYI